MGERSLTVQTVNLILGSLKVLVATFVTLWGTHWLNNSAKEALLPLWIFQTPVPWGRKTD